MDPLSQAIALLKPEAKAWRVFEAHDAWSVRFPETDHVVFGQIIEGACEVRLAEGAALDLGTGDFILINAPKPWIARTSGDIVPVDLKSVIADRALLLTAEAARVTRFIAGAFVLAAPNADLLASLMPRVVHVRGADVAAGRLGAMLKLLGDEALTERPGRSLVLERLLELILVESLRHAPAALVDARPGLLAGLADARIGVALRAMHKEVQRPWTVAELARRAGMSRSAFAARFAETVGSSPIEYLWAWRIALAKSALRSSDKPMTEVAELAGYASVSAFSTAFSRASGVSPTAYARAARAVREREADGRQLTVAPVTSKTVTFSQ